MSEQRFIVARSDWHAREMLKKIYKGHVPSENLSRILFQTREEGNKRIQKLRGGVMEEYSLYQVAFDAEKIEKLGEPVSRIS